MSSVPPITPASQRWTIPANLVNPFELNQDAANLPAETTPADWLLWQLADSAFPTGGFAHSGGLEAAWQHHEIKTSVEFLGFLRSSLVQTGRGALPFMTAVFESPDRLDELDRLSDCFLTNHVANRASRLQGQALLASAERIFGRARLAKTLSENTRPAFGHLSPVFGGIAHDLRLERRQAARLFLFWNLRGWTASAVRLGLVGPMEAQSMQSNLAAFAESVLDGCLDIPVENAAQTAPLLDLLQGAQDRLYSRLFQS